MDKVSMIDFSYNLLLNNDGALSLEEMVRELKIEREWTDEKAISILSQLNTQLTLDGRFVILADGKWDLRDRHLYELVNPVYSDFDFEEEIEAIEEDEEEDYDTLDKAIVEDEEEENSDKKTIESLIHITNENEI